MTYLENIRQGKELLLHLFSQVLEQKVTRVLVSYKACATLDFGKDLIVEVQTSRGVDRFTRGEWSFWLYACAWRLEQGRQCIIGSRDCAESIKVKLLLLETKKLKQVEVLNEAFDLVLSFEDNMRLFVFSDSTESDEYWELATPDRKVFSIHPQHIWCYEDSSRIS